MFLTDFAEFGIGKTILNNPGKTIMTGTVLAGAGGVGASYLNKKDKRTLRQRVVDTGKAILPIGIIGGIAASNTTDRLMGSIRRKYGEKGAIAAALTSVSLVTGGHLAAQQARRRHAEKTQKQRKKGQRLKVSNMNVLGVKYKDYTPMNVE